jgi:hypothetical protein
VALKSVKNGKYLAINKKEGNASATGNHPILYVPDLDFHKCEEMIVLKFDNREYTGVITFGSAVCF